MNIFKKVFIFAFIVILIAPSIAGAIVHVNGYFRANGTYVAPHYRSSPNSTPTDNWSYPGNTNPMTGKTATGNPETYLKNYKNSSIPISTTPTPIISLPAVNSIDDLAAKIASLKLQILQLQMQILQLQGK